MSGPRAGVSQQMAHPEPLRYFVRSASISRSGGVFECYRRLGSVEQAREHLRRG